MSNIIGGTSLVTFPVVSLDATPDLPGGNYRQKIAAIGNAGGYAVTWSGAHCNLLD